MKLKYFKKSIKKIDEKIKGKEIFLKENELLKEVRRIFLIIISAPSRFTHKQSDLISAIKEGKY